MNQLKVIGRRICLYRNCISCNDQYALQRY